MTNLHCGGHCIYLQEHYTSSPSLSHAHPLPPFSFFLYASTVAAPVCKILSFRFLTFHNNNKITDAFCHHHRFHHYRTTLTNIYTSTTTTTTSTTSTTTTNTRIQYFIYRTSERYLSSCSCAGCRSTRIMYMGMQHTTDARCTRAVLLLKTKLVREKINPSEDTPHRVRPTEEKYYFYRLRPNARVTTIAVYYTRRAPYTIKTARAGRLLLSFVRGQERLRETDTDGTCARRRFSGFRRGEGPAEPPGRSRGATPRSQPPRHRRCVH